MLTEMQSPSRPLREAWGGAEKSVLLTSPGEILMGVVHGAYVEKPCLRG